MTSGPDLAYLIAVGHRRYRMAARTAVESLIGPGGFRGRVVVLSDHALRLPAGVETRRVEDPALIAEPKRLKFRIGDYLSVSEYRHVLFLDADLVTRADLVAPIAEPLASGGLVCTDDIRQTVDRGLCHRCLDAEELAVHGGRSLGVNSGFFAAAGARIGDYLRTWEGIVDACADWPGEGFDQPGLNAAMLRARLPVCLVPGLMWFPRRDPQRARCRADAPLVHFHGAGRRWTRAWRMRTFARRVAREAGRS